MTAAPTPAGFSDGLADEYHLIYADWDAAITRQARVVTGLLHNLGLTSCCASDRPATCLADMPPKTDAPVRYR